MSRPTRAEATRLLIAAATARSAPLTDDETWRALEVLGVSLYGFESALEAPPPYDPPLRGPYGGAFVSDQASPFAEDLTDDVLTRGEQLDMCPDCGSDEDPCECRVDVEYVVQVEGRSATYVRSCLSTAQAITLRRRLVEAPRVTAVRVTRA